MKSRILFACALFAASVAAASAQAPGAFTITCGQTVVTQNISSNTMVGTFNCTSTATINGSPFKGLTYSTYAQYGPAENNVWGVIVGTLASGDEVFLEYHNVIPVRNGIAGIGNLTYKITGGTGAVNGITGSGTCKTQTTPGGSAQDCVGGYATH